MHDGDAEGITSLSWTSLATKHDGNAESITSLPWTSLATMHGVTTVIYAEVRISLQHVIPTHIIQ